MKTEKVIRTNVETVTFGYIKGEDFIPLDNEETIVDFAKNNNCPEILVRTIANAFNYLTEEIRNDLIDIWKRLDRIESEIDMNK